MTTRGCLGKIGYGSKAEACRAKARIAARRRDRRDETSVYRCELCGKHHLGRRGSVQGLTDQRAGRSSKPIRCFVADLSEASDS